MERWVCCLSQLVKHFCVGKTPAAYCGLPTRLPCILLLFLEGGIVPTNFIGGILNPAPFTDCEPEHEEQHDDANDKGCPTACLGRLDAPSHASRASPQEAASLVEIAVLEE